MTIHKQSLIQSEVDFERQGVHGGYLRIPHSVHRSAYGWIPVPVISLRNGDGPVVLLLGGNHGDEFEGQVALSRLASRLDLDGLHGQVIILPMANYPAARAGLRTSPLDQGNLNRSFPGDPGGNPTQMMAHYIESELLHRADFLLDVHSGGSSMVYQPTLLMAEFVDSGTRERARRLVDALDFPRVVLYAESRSANYSSSAARRQSVIGITAEMAGGGNVDRAAMALLEGALPRYLQACGVYDQAPPEQRSTGPEYFRLDPDTSYLYAMQEGIFEPVAGVNEDVEAGQLAGWIHTPDVPLAEPVTLEFPASGRILSMRVPARVERGDCLYELAALVSVGDPPA